MIWKRIKVGYPTDSPVRLGRRKRLRVCKARKMKGAVQARKVSLGASEDDVK